MKRLRLWFLVAFFLHSLPCYSRGDKIIPQVVDGTGIRTKLDLTNVSPGVAIGKFKLKFYQKDGSAWIVRTSLGNASEYALNIAARQTLRIETQGLTSPAAAGYALIEDNETSNSQNSMDYVLGISVYYEISNARGVVDTVSVPVPQPTALGTLPVEYTQAKGVYTGIAVVNLTNGVNALKVDLYGTGSNTLVSATINLEPGQQRSEFFHENMFPALRTQDFKGLAEFKADGPVAILALLQTSSYTGDVQYATLVPTDRESLRRNSYMYVPEAPYVGTTGASMPVDVDNFIVDYFRVGNDEGYSWDLLYEATGKTARQIKPVNGAAVCILGVLENAAFDAVSLPQLMSLNYVSTPIDMSDGKAATQLKYSFAVLTELGNFAKVRLVATKQFNDAAGNPFVDLMFEAVVYR